MSIGYCAAIVVGASWASLTNEQKDLADSLIEQGELEDFPPYYDAYRKGVVGIAVEMACDYSYTTVDYTDRYMIAMKEKFKEMVGVEAKLYITTVGT